MTGAADPMITATVADAATDDGANVERVRLLFDRMFPAGDLDGIRTLVAPGFLDHTPAPGQPPGSDGAVYVVEQLRAALENFTTTVDDILADGDRVAVRWTWRGRNTAPLYGQPATGRLREQTAIVILRLTEGRIVERWAGFSPAPRHIDTAPAAGSPLPKPGLV